MQAEMWQLNKQQQLHTLVNGAVCMCQVQQRSRERTVGQERACISIAILQCI